MKRTQVRRPRHRRPAFLLMLALIAMLAVAPFTGVITRTVAADSGTRQRAAAQRTPRLVAASAAAWVAQQRAWVSDPPTTPQTIDIADLVPPGQSATVEIVCQAAESSQCTVIARARAGRQSGRATVEVSLGGPQDREPRNNPEAGMELP